VAERDRERKQSGPLYFINGRWTAYVAQPEIYIPIYHVLKQLDSETKQEILIETYLSF